MNEFKNTQEMYDKNAVAYTKQINVYKNILFIREQVYRLLSPVNGKMILSIGCGEGTECAIFAQNGAKVVGIDSSNELINIAKNEYPNLGIEFFVMDYEKTSFEDSIFDGIISIQSIMYKENLMNVLLELKRILKSDGKMVIVVPHPIRKMIKYANFNYFDSGLHFETWEGVTRYNYYRTIEEYYSLIKKSGLQVEEILEPKPQLDQPYKVVNNVREDMYPHVLFFVLQKNR